ncbi:MAG: ThiF family adenylyltransferase [Proteobacteria bacterium]|nr:ThiF family adenylyltransferase [Pseudomonadota bacterium]
MKIIDCNAKRSPSIGSEDSPASEICTRHVLVFGESVQQRISDMTVGIVSAGGLGSIIIEQLMRLFPKKIVNIDNDEVELSNLNRLVGATVIDSKLRTRKVDLVSRNILQFNPQQDITAIFGDFLKKEYQDQFRQCDFILGASDSNAVRIATNRLCLAHGIPYLDCGVGAVVKEGQLQAAGGQVIKVLPNSGFCLHCSGMFNVTEAMNEFLSGDEKERQENQGYIRGTQINAPQVYSLNMMVASWAVWIFTRMVTGEDLDFDGIAIDARGLESSTWKELSKTNMGCPTCGRNGIVFGGDDVDLLCIDEPELNEAEIKAGTSSTTDNPQRIKGRIEREMPIPRCPGTIIGDNVANPFCSGLFGVM